MAIIMGGMFLAFYYVLQSFPETVSVVIKTAGTQREVVVHRGYNGFTPADLANGDRESILRTGLIAGRLEATVKGIGP